MTTEKKTIVTIRLNAEEIEQVMLESLNQNEETMGIVDSANDIKITFITQTNGYDLSSGQTRVLVRGMKFEIELED